MIVLTEEELNEIKERITAHKEYRKLIHQGVFYRIESPFDQKADTAWIVVSENKTEAIAVYYFNLHYANAGFVWFKLKGLDEVKHNFFAGNLF